MMLTSNSFFVLSYLNPFFRQSKFGRYNLASKRNISPYKLFLQFYSILTTQLSFPYSRIRPKMPSLLANHSQPNIVQEKKFKILSDLHQYDPEQIRLMEEMCIVVDVQDKILGFDTKFNTHLWSNIEESQVLHRAFSVFLFNEKYELLLQQRSNEKITFPGYWTNTCCSHPLYLDTEKEGVEGCRHAGLRKLVHELGITHTPPLTYLTRIHYKAPSDTKWGEHEIDYIFFGQGSFQVHRQPNEVLNVRYVNENELRELIRLADTNPDQLKITPWFRMICENLLFKWWKHLRNGTLDSCVVPNEIFKLSLENKNSNHLD